MSVMPVWNVSDFLSLDDAKAASVSLTGLQLDSRKVVPGDLFFACLGNDSDGRDYIEQAISAGAVAVIYENCDGFEYSSDEGVYCLGVNNLGSQVGHFAARFYMNPSQEMQVFGVTGTNGKTSSCYLLAQALEILGMPSALIGTLGVGPIGALKDSGHTTPDVISVHKLLANWLDQGIRHVCMEVSSHALDQGRVNGVEFFCTLFTNFSQDHLDYHGDMASYRRAKERLFTEFEAELVVTNLDDEVGGGLIDIANANFVSSFGDSGDLQIEEVESNEAGLKIAFATANEDFEVQSKIIGAVNAPNIALLCATLLALGIEIEQITEIVAQLKPAPGRMQLVDGRGWPKVVVDYAHTPDALEKALNSIKPHCDGDLWCVFGCGGDRDKAKRSLMGKAAAEFADYLVITDDNPRSEAPESIVSEILSGVDLQTHDQSLEVIHDRKAAIKYAIENAKDKDWVLLAGKGHETGQTFADKTLPFNDFDVTQSLLGAAI